MLTKSSLSSPFIQFICTVETLLAFLLKTDMFMPCLGVKIGHPLAIVKRHRKKEWPAATYIFSQRLLLLNTWPFVMEHIAHLTIVVSVSSVNITTCSTGSYSVSLIELVLLFMYSFEDSRLNVLYKFDFFISGKNKDVRRARNTRHAPNRKGGPGMNEF